MIPIILVQIEEFKLVDVSSVHGSFDRNKPCEKFYGLIMLDQCAMNLFDLQVCPSNTSSMFE